MPTDVCTSVGTMALSHGSFGLLVRPESVRLGEAPVDAAHAIPASFGSCSSLYWSPYCQAHEDIHRTDSEIMPDHLHMR